MPPPPAQTTRPTSCWTTWTRRARGPYVLVARVAGARGVALRKRLAALEGVELKELKLLAQFFTIITGAQGQCEEAERTGEVRLSRWDAVLCTQLVARCEAKATLGGRLAGLVTEARRWLQNNGGWLVVGG